MLTDDFRECFKSDMVIVGMKKTVKRLKIAFEK